MNIFIDESGSFVSATHRGSWNVVAAVAAPESDRRAIEKAIKALHPLGSGALSKEVKLGDLNEDLYLIFLDMLATTQTILFATATDAGLNSVERIRRHQNLQVGSIRANIPRMRYESGRQGLRLIADQLESVSPQLYAQLVCQVDLLHDVLRRSITYFAQRVPGTLREFRWRIDQKNTKKTTYEEAFEKIAPVLLQTRSLRDPGIKVEGFDYRHLAPFEFPNGRHPDYLEQEYGIRVENTLNIQKLIRGNLKFEDSKSSLGIQVADLLASGLRRCLRGNFTENDKIAKALGRLTLQNEPGRFPVHLIAFAEQEGEVDADASRVVKSFAKQCRSMLTNINAR